MKCPVCQRENPEDARFCNLCGYNLQEPDQTLPIDAIKPHPPKVTPDKTVSPRSAPEGERKRLTMLFADLSGYTAMNERIDPEEVKGIMRRIFGEIGQVVTKYDGFVDRFFGDEVMIVFGVPRAHEDDPVRAVRAAIQIHDLINNMSPQFEERIGQPLRMHIGINTGLVVTGDEYIGKGRHGLTGDAINLAARLTKLARADETLVGSDTYRATEKYFTFEPLKPVRVKGKEEPVTFYRVIAPSTKEMRLDAAVGRRVFSEMVGRDKELDKIKLQVMKAMNGQGSIVNVIGEAGIGKSRLVSEIRDNSMMKRATLLEGRAISIGRNLSFYPIIDLLKHWAKITEEDTGPAPLSKLETAVRTVSREKADEMVPFIATLMGMNLTGKYAERIKGIEGEALEKLILKNVKDLIIKSTELTPLVIIMEDLHWADISSIELLESLFHLAECHSILFINLFRPNHPETGDRIVENLKEKISVYYVEINLDPLSEQMSKTLINNMLNIKGLQYAVVDQIIERSGGNPFFIEEVVRSFIDEGVLVKTNGEFKVTEKIEKMVIPHTINDVLMARIDRLDDNTRDLVKVASVIGRSFFYRILKEVAKTIDGIDDRLFYLKEIQLIRERRRMEELEYLFKHALAQEAAYTSILHQKRKQLHRNVADSIERVFFERLHEFYGMLAMHYTKAEDFEKAEYYLVKAGEEALRSAASSEALNYYQEGLNLYLQFNKDTADPEKLAMFEKNIAMALLNKSKMEESVEHFDKVLEYWNVPAQPSRLLILLESIKNIISIMTGLEGLFKKTKPCPSQRDIEILDIFYLRNCAYTHFDNIRLFFHTLSAFNRAIQIDMSKCCEAITILINVGGMFSFTCLSFKISRKFLERSKAEMDIKNIESLMPYKEMLVILFCFSGDWQKLGTFEETIPDEALEKGDFFNSLAYMLFFFTAQSEMGNFAETDLGIQKLYKIADDYSSPMAQYYAHILKIDVLIKKKLFSEALEVVEQGVKFAGQSGKALEMLYFLSNRTEIYVYLNKIGAAKESFTQVRGIYERNKKFLVPAHASLYLVAQFVMNMHFFEKGMVDADKSELARLRKKTYKSGQAALKGLRKYAPFRTKTFRLMGKYFWLAGKQKKALQWWDKAIKKGEELGARPDLSRTYFEVGKSLLEPHSKYEKLSGITAEEYLKKAKVMFEEMDLQRDLNEFDKVMTTI